ncbi:MAG TPA: hypothetical protein VKB50_07980, partial [Vicinamibacterales bacterium]|nr:hypothetical protein [Vicinamibacterales bacterium]
MERFKARPDAPSWWFGAPLIGVAFGFVANRFFPEFVAWSATIIYQISGNGPAPAAVAPDVTR